MNVSDRAVSIRLDQGEQVRLPHPNYIEHPAVSEALATLQRVHALLMEAVSAAQKAKRAVLDAKSADAARVAVRRAYGDLKRVVTENAPEWSLTVRERYETAHADFEKARAEMRRAADRV